jgi:hypothetical protein
MANGLGKYKKSIHKDFTLRHYSINNVDQYWKRWFTKCIHWSGPKQWLGIPDNDLMSIADIENSNGAAVTGGILTVSAWIRLESGDHYNGIIGKFQHHGDKEEWQFYIDNAEKLHLELHDNGGDSSESNYGIADCYSSDAVPRDMWCHVAATYDGRGGNDAADGIKYYINGVESSTSQATGGTNVMNDDGNYTKTSNTTGLGFLGYHQSGGGAILDSGLAFHGKIAQICYWKGTALGAADIANLFKIKDPEARTATFHPPTAYWRMGSGKSPDGTIDDAIGLEAGLGVGDSSADEDGNRIYDQIGTMHAVPNFAGTDVQLASGYLLGSNMIIMNLNNDTDTEGALGDDKHPINLGIRLGLVSYNAPLRLAVEGPASLRAAPPYKVELGITSIT